MNNPKLIPKPFAINGQKNEIPDNSSGGMDGNQATWDTGFGAITMLPVAAGGLPPKGQDFNGILNQISENIVYLSDGGRYKFSADHAKAIGGYKKGAILQSNDQTKEYQSLIDNNIVDFNDAGWNGNSWKLVTSTNLIDLVNDKQNKGDYATNTALTTGLSSKIGNDKKSDSTSSSSSDTVATSKAVKAAMDTASTTYIKLSQRSSAVNSSSEATVATSKAVKTVADSISMAVIPVGIPLPWPQSTPPKGWLRCDGTPFDKSIYPELAKAYPSGVLPDLRGEFIRGWDDGRGVDAGRILGSYQEDTFKEHQHIVKRNAAGPAGHDQTGFFAHGFDGNNNGPIKSYGTTPPGGTETRPRNIAFLYIVRAA